MDPLLLVLVLFVLFWFLIVRPQRRRQLQQRRLLEELEPGDEIVSTGGIFGVIREIDDTELHVEIAEGIVVKMARRAVAGLVEREEPKEDEPAEGEPQEPEEAETPPAPS